MFRFGLKRRVGGSQERGYALIGTGMRPAPVDFRDSARIDDGWVQMIVREMKREGRIYWRFSIFSNTIFIIL